MIYRWRTAGVPLGYRISRKKAGIPPVFLQLIGQYLALRSIDPGRFGLHFPCYSMPAWLLDTPRVPMMYPACETWSWGKVDTVGELIG